MKPEQPTREDHGKYLNIRFPYAYNIIGAVEDAKDAVQEALMKHLCGPQKEIADERNYLIRSVINLAINVKARNKKLRRDDLWLPEPIATGDAPDKNLHLNEVLSYSLMVLMERLNARERAVFILRESFDYTHTEIADILSISEEHSRKLLSRAKASLYKPGPKQLRIGEGHERDVLMRFMSAIRERDTMQLEAVVAEDIRFYADGGGKVPLVAKTSHGAANVAALQIKVYHSFLTKARIVYTLINHQPALLSFVNERLLACQVFDVHAESGSILQINAVLDPDKLKSLGQQYS